MCSPEVAGTLYGELTSYASRRSIAPRRVKLLTQASAKSHRPERLFSRDSCPIIGAGRLGEIFVKASAAGLEKLGYEIEHKTSSLVVKELSTIEIPLVSSALAQVYHQITPTPSPVLARALLTHHARPTNQCTRARRRGELSWIREASPAALLHRVHSKLVDVGIRRYFAPGLLS